MFVTCTANQSKKSVNLFELILKLNGYPINKAKKHYSIISNKSIEERKSNILQYHLDSSNLYSEIANEYKTNHWNQLPVMSKDKLLKSISDRIDSNYSKKEVHISKTSGSSGFPFIYAKDKFCHALTWSHILSEYEKIGIDYSKSYQARFYAIPKDFINYRKELVKDYFSNRKRFVIFDMSDNKLDQFINVFRKEKFDYIYGYTSSIVLFANHLKKYDITLDEICPSVKLCITTSEMLDEIDKSLLEKQFKVPIYNEYGASELGLLAFQNSKGVLELNNETLYTEIVDDQGNPEENGKVGRILVTSLYNYAHPFIRYEVGDLGSIEVNPVTNKKYLSKLIGRTNEFAILPSNKRVPAFTFCYVAKSIAKESDNVKEIKVIQKTKSDFVVNYTSLKELSKEQKNKISKAFEIYLEPGLNIYYKRQDQLERSKSGKLKQFISQVKT